MVRSKKLQEFSPLGNYSKHFGRIVLHEVTGKALVSVAIPLGGDNALNYYLKHTLNVIWPTITKTERSEDSKIVLYGLQSDIIFALFDRGTDKDVLDFMTQFSGLAYCTDQSDAWTILGLRGEGSTAALEHICPLNLSLVTMPIGCVMRTMMEHLGVIIIREDVDSFVLMSASSSAKSFVHAIELSIQNTRSSDVEL